MAGHSGADHENTSIWELMGDGSQTILGKILQVEMFVFLRVQNQLIKWTFRNCKLDADNFCNSNGIKLTLTETKKTLDGPTTDVRTKVIGIVL
jgi:hypothetical protein